MKAKKNDIVYRVSSWNNLNEACVREMKVRSWGKKQAKFIRTDNGENVEELFYLNDGEGCNFFATKAEAVATGMEHLHQTIEKNLYYENDYGYRAKVHGRDLGDYYADRMNGYAKNGLIVVDYPY
jgi:hypothetical protein